MDAKSTLLNGVFKKEVYVDQPPEFEVKGKEHKVYKLKKELYRLKKAPRACYNCTNSYFLRHMFNIRNNEPMLYTKKDKQDKIMICFLYVDDKVYIGNLILKDFQSTMKEEYEMFYLSSMK